jgi:dienelactone hydrolase
MSVGEIFFLSTFLFIQFYLVLFYFRTFKIIHGKRHGRLSMFLGAQMLCIFSIIAGGYIEKRWSFYSLGQEFVRQDSSYRSSPLEGFEVGGDPSLVQWVQRKRPNLPRPDLTDAAALLKWQDSLRHTLLEVFDLLRMTSLIDVNFREVSSVFIAPDITRTFLVYKSFDGTSIPAYLFTPQISGRQPAILVLHGHVGENEEGITQTAGIVDSYQNKAALELAKAGYVTLTVEFRGFGYLGRRINTEHRLIAHNAILGGSFYKAVISKDIKYAIDLLQSLEQVNPMRIGITGVSYGGEMAATYAALDERIKVVVFQGFGPSLSIQPGVTGTHEELPHYCHIIPNHNTLLLQEDIFLLIAPRPLLGVGGDQEYSGIPEFSEVVNKVYKSLNASSLYRFEIIHGGHEYFIQPALRFFNRFL